MKKIYTIGKKNRIFKNNNFLMNLSLTNKIIIFTCITYILSIILTSILGEKFFLENLALTPALITSGKKPWTIITSIFMHGSMFHLFANMFSLFFLGNFLEKIIGDKKFFYIFLSSGLMGGIFYILGALIFNTPTISAVGASGAIFGLLGTLAILIPYSKIYLIVGPLILIVLQVVANAIFPLKFLPTIDIIINVLLLVMVFSLFSFNTNLRKIAIPIKLQMWVLPIIAIVPLVIIAQFIPLPIGNSAHIGGLVVGLICGIYLKIKYKNKMRMISNHFR